MLHERPVGPERVALLRRPALRHSTEHTACGAVCKRSEPILRLAEIPRPFSGNKISDALSQKIGGDLFRLSLRQAL